MRVHLANAAGLLMILCGQPVFAAEAPKTWDGLVQVDSKKLDLVYLQPGADFRGYTKVMIDPTEVGFAKNWQRDHNRSRTSISGHVSDREIERAVTEGSRVAGRIFANAWSKGGYAVVDAPAPDAVRVKTGVLNISVTAPEQQTAGSSHTFSEDAGRATFFVEIRDSMTGALLGRAVDQHVIGDSFTTWRTASTNRADFRDQVELWARMSVHGLSELQSLSPIQP